VGHYQQEVLGERAPPILAEVLVPPAKVELAAPVGVVEVKVCSYKVHCIQY